MATFARPFAMTGVALASIATIAVATPAVQGQFAGVSSPLKLSTAQYELAAFSDITVQGITHAIAAGYGGFIAANDTYFPGEFNNDAILKGTEGAAYYLIDTALTDPLNLENYFFEVGSRGANLLTSGAGAAAYVGVASTFGVDSIQAQVLKTFLNGGLGVPAAASVAAADLSALNLANLNLGGLDIGALLNNVIGNVDIAGLIKDVIGGANIGNIINDLVGGAIGTAVVSLTAGIPVVGTLTSIYFTGKVPGDTTSYGTGFTGVISYATRHLGGIITGVINGIKQVIGGIIKPKPVPLGAAANPVAQVVRNVLGTPAAGSAAAAVASVAGPAAAATAVKPATSVGEDVAKANKDAKASEAPTVEASSGNAVATPAADAPSTDTPVASGTEAPANLTTAPAPKRSAQRGAARAAERAAARAAKRAKVGATS